MIDNNFNDKLRSGAYVRVLCESGYKEALFGLSLSYRTLTPLEIIIHQRKNHRSQKWNIFIEQLLKQIQHPQLLIQTN